MPWSFCLPFQLRSSSSPSPSPSPSSTATATATPHCPFCALPPSSPDSPSSPNPFRIVLESDDFIAFHDRTPRARIHLQTVTRRHIPSVKALRPRGAERRDSREEEEDGAELVRRMREFALRALAAAAAVAVAAEGQGQGQGQGRSRSEGKPDGRREDPSRSSLSLPAVAGDDAQAQAQPLLGFHIPPLTSVQHLHMHTLLPPLSRVARWVKYRDTDVYAGANADADADAGAGAGGAPRRRLFPSPSASASRSRSRSRSILAAQDKHKHKHKHKHKLKHWGWFVSAQTAEEILRAGERISVGAVSAWAPVDVETSG